MEILNYINGEWVKPTVKDYFDVINPATGVVIARTPLGTKADVEGGCGIGGEGGERSLCVVAARAGQ